MTYRAIKPAGNYSSAVIVNEYDETIAMVHCLGTDVTDAPQAQHDRARLFAAAPDLLEALRIAEAKLWELEPNMAAHQAIQAAIAAATNGEV
jgi:hypothetical protein